MNRAPSVLCPICSGVLEPNGRSYACARRHSFDLSREGYLSLVAGRAGHRNQGDDKEMVEARVRVHRLAPYLELANAISELCSPIVRSGAILDVGCGDGYFLEHISNALGPEVAGVGVDISRDALVRAARLYPNRLFLRSDAAGTALPFAQGAFSLVLSIFAPRPQAEILRVLASGGCWIVATAAPDHLAQLRDFIPLSSLGPGKIEELAGATSVVARRLSVVRTQTLNRAEIASVVAMSPSVHRLRRESGDEWVLRLPESLDVTFSFEGALITRPT